jgi:hypothetical protein
VELILDRWKRPEESRRFAVEREIDVNGRFAPTVEDGARTIGEVYSPTRAGLAPQAPHERDYPVAARTLAHSRARSKLTRRRIRAL